MATDEKQEYLGDSVYACISRGMVKLTTDNGYGPTNAIYLEPEVMASLQAWYAQVVAECAAERLKDAEVPNGD